MVESAFNWDVYKNRRSALQYLKQNRILVDTIIETEDGRAHELVHSQVLSAFGDKLTKFIQDNGVSLPVLSNESAPNGHQHQHNLSPLATALHRERPQHQHQSQARQSQQPPPQYSRNYNSNNKNNNNNNHNNSNNNKTSNYNSLKHGQLSHLVHHKNANRLRLVRLPKVNRYTLGILVECAYSGYIRTDLASGGIWQVLDMADYYEMSDVIRACCAFLIKNLNRSNCIYFYHIGMKHKHPLQRCAWHQICSNFKHILAQNLINSANILPQIGPLGPTNRTNNSNMNQCNNTARVTTITTTTTPTTAGAIRQLPSTQHTTDLPSNDDLSSQRRATLAPASSHESRQISNRDRNDLAGGQARHFGATLSAATSPPPPPRPSSSVPSSSSSSSLSILSRRSNHCTGQQRAIIEEHIRANSLATIKHEHFEPLLAHDKLNIDSEESVWHAIRLWCNYNLSERSAKVATLLPCIRFPRFRTGTEFSARHIWRDPLIINNETAQHQLAVLDRNHREYLAGAGSARYKPLRDGFNLPCAANPRQLRPRIPCAILLAIGGWQQGQPTTLIESYDINCNMWFDSKKRIRSPLAYHGIECIDGLLYICGGTDGNDILSDLFTFDPIRGDCAQKPPMRDSRCYVSTAHLGQHLYALGGHNGAQRMRSVERFDLIAQEWSHVHDMNVARSDASACVYGALIYIAGGLNDQVIESSVEYYNSADNTWTFITSMLMPRTSFTLLAYRQMLLAIGGNNGSERLNSVEQYDFVTRSWTQHSQMRHKRSTFSAALVDETKLIVVGGYNGQTPFSQVEMFDETSHQWILLQKIRYDRSGLKVVVVKDLPNASEYTFLGSQAGQYRPGGTNSAGFGGPGGGGGISGASSTSSIIGSINEFV